MEEVHEWEFLQTLWEVDRNTSTSTWGNSREYAYFACHLCGKVEKRIVELVVHTNPPKVESESKQ